MKKINMNTNSVAFKVKKDDTFEYQMNGNTINQ